MAAKKGARSKSRAKSHRDLEAEAEAELDAAEEALLGATEATVNALKAIEGFALVKDDPEKRAEYARKYGGKIVKAMAASGKLCNAMIDTFGGNCG